MFVVRPVLWWAAAAALLALSPEAARSTLSTAAAALLEATPFLFAGAALQRVVGSRALAPFLGCGCEPGPSARSLPAAIAACLVFGPAVAAARLAAGIFVGRRAGRTAGTSDGCRHRAAGPLAGLTGLIPSAATAGVFAHAFAAVDPARLPAFLQLLSGATLGFFGAPCALGAVAIAATLRARAPLSCWAFLSVAGIVDLRSLGYRRPETRDHDGFGYALLAIALVAAGARHGAGLVHPALSLPLEGAGLAAATVAWRYRRSRDVRSRAAPALVLAGLFVAAPPPPYRATETTMNDLFAGERLSFTGQLARDGNHAALVRYAITCCRADAAPVVVRLQRAPRDPAGTWFRANGTVERSAGGLGLRAEHLARVTPPADPFVYR